MNPTENNTPTKILIADHAPSYLIGFLTAMKADGIQTQLVTSGRELLNALSNSGYDCVLLRYELPDHDGLKLLEAIRESDPYTPVVLISGGEEGCLLRGLTAGADSIAQNMIDPLLLAASLKALIRRYSRTASSHCREIRVGEFSYSLRSADIWKNGQKLELTSTENALMRLFLMNPGRIFSKDELYRIVWGSTFTDDNVVMIYISRLRKKIEECPSRPVHIMTIRGLGYEFIPEREQSHHSM